MPGRGKIAILLMFLLGLAMASYAWWVQYHKGQRILQFWGPQASNLIRHAPRAELLLLRDPLGEDADSPVGPASPSEPEPPSEREAPSGGPGSPESASQPGQIVTADTPGEASEGGRTAETLSLPDGPVTVSRSVDISETRGLVHARHTLVVDANYQWDAERAGCQASWQFALRFSDAESQATLVFDTNCDRVRLLEQDREVGLSAGLMRALRERAPRWADQPRLAP